MQVIYMKDDTEVQLKVLSSEDDNRSESDLTSQTETKNTHLDLISFICNLSSIEIMNLSDENEQQFLNFLPESSAGS